jgi:glutamate dehydrogenase/leucine dehydrogenase
MVDEYEKISGDRSHASFTGKSIEKGGSLGRESATGGGGVIALAELLKKNKYEDSKLTIAIQGFGNVGSFFSTISKDSHPDWSIIAASDSSQTVYDENGLDVRALADHKRSGGRFKDYPQAAVKRAGEDIIGIEADVLVLAALGGAVTEKNMKQVKAKYIVELANGPLDESAQAYMAQQNIVVLPGIIANAGGVVVSYLEWLQNKRSEQWPADKVNQKLETYMTRAVNDMLDTAREHHIKVLPEAASVLALKRLISRT